MEWHVKMPEIEVWKDHYKFVMISAILLYPETLPNAIVKRRYYDFFINMGHIMPTASIGEKYAAALEMYPVQPYLDGKSDLFRWYTAIMNYVYEMNDTESDVLKMYAEKCKPKTDMKLYKTFIVKYTVVIGVLALSYYLS